MRNNSNNALIESYSYDAFHNRKQRSSSASTDYYVYDSAQQLLEIRATSATGSLNKAFVYDSVGNMTQKCEGGTVTRSASACSGTTSLTLGYNSLNQLSTASKTGLASESYQYDGLGNRIEKVVGSSPQRFVYSGASIFTEYNASWTSAQASHVMGGLDAPLMRAKAIGQGDYYHPDGLGSIVISTNEADTITGKRVYDAWGKVSTSSGSVPTYGFAGREPDATGLVYLRARYYDPDTGRFTQPDPLGFIDGINRYAYAKNSPVNFVDPWGTTAREPSGFIDATLNYFSNNPDELVSLGLGFTPAGVLLDLGTLLTGRDMITGEAVPWYWGAVGMIPAASELRKASNAVNTVSDIAEVAAKLPAAASGIVGDAVKSVSNPVPDTLARVISDNPITRASGTLGRSGTDDVFVTAAEDIRGLNAKQIAERLTIPESPTGFRIIEFPTPKTGIASPVNRTDSGFIGGGRTAGGAREFVIPNGAIPVGASTRIVP